MAYLWSLSLVLAVILGASAVSSSHVAAGAHQILPRVTTLTSPTGSQQTGTISTCNKWYTVVSGDTCDTVEKAFGITLQQFITWNPAVSSDCTQNFWTGYTYCVGVKSSAAPSTSTQKQTSSTKTGTTTKPVSGTSTVETAPNKPTMSGIPCNCNRYYDVVSGDTCSTVESKFGITHAQFLQWNPTVSQDCGTNFWTDESYCVGVSSSPCSSTAHTTVQPPTTTSIPPNTQPYTTIGNETSAVKTDRPTATGWPPAPTGKGSAANCLRYYYVNPGDTCDSIAIKYSHILTKDDFLSWNPSVLVDCSGLYVNYYYCVDVPIDSYSLPNATTQILPSWTPSSLPVMNTTFVIPQPTASGAVSSCQAWYLAVQNDTCDSIVAALGYLALSDFKSWNTGASCPTIVAGTNYCVANYAGSQLPMPSTVTKTPSPTQSGLISSCKAWYLANEADTCDLIPQYFGTFSKNDFLTWNPSIGQTCSGLVAGDYYCVAIPGTPTTRTAPPASTTALPTNGVGPQPEQPGIPSDCFAYWLVSSTDNCTTIAQANAIAETQLEAWNPALGKGCPNLTENYYICVGAPSGATGTSSPSPPASSSSTGIGGVGSSSTSAPSSIKTTSSSVMSIATPTPTQTGMIAGCHRFYRVESGDGCFAIASAAGIALNDFYAWNPAVKTDCSLLEANVYVCIGISGAVVTISTGTPVAATPAPTQTGMTSGCSRFYLVESGDGCAAIASQAGIVLNDFYSWNPAVGTSCQGLLSGVYVCIGTSGVPGTTITSGPAQPAKT